jgi:membrane associated rhomboid family serine protease/Zn-finger nucleic acid-binding protein
MKYCPQCRRAALDRVHAQHADAEICVRCGGAWFDAGGLAKAIRSHAPNALAPGPIADQAGVSLGASDKSCPTCAVSLALHRLSSANPLDVEICPNCSGVWLVQGALARAKAGHELPPARARIDAERSWGDWFFQFLAGMPVEFNVQPRRVPVVTYSLIAANGIIFQLMSYWWIFGTGSPLDLALRPDMIWEPVWFGTLMTSQFLHSGTVHLLGNMYFLWILGDNVEDVIGRPWFLAFYLAAGVAAGAAYSLITSDPEIPVVGASGAISGVLGAYAVLFRRSRLTFMLVVWQFKLTAPIYVGIWAAFNVGGWWVGVPGVAWEAHLGGLAFGIAVGMATYRPLMQRRPLLRLLNEAAR